MSAINGLTIAVPRGALFEDTVELLARLGVDTEELRGNDRKLLFEEIGVITMRPSDVPTYVEAGAADLGITGKDVLVEQALGQQALGGRPLGASGGAGNLRPAARCTSCSTSATDAARWCSRASPASPIPRRRRCAAWG